MAIPLQASPSSSSTTVADDDIQTKQTTTFNPFKYLESSPKTQFLDKDYSGNGTPTSPFLVEFLPNDPHDPVTFSTTKKWTITALQAISTLAVTFASSAYSGGIREIIRHFGVSIELATVGVSLFVLGFAVGPLLWAPLSELYGRQRIFVISFMIATAFDAAAAGANSMAALLVLRFFAGAFGSSSLTNAGGVVADMFNASERGFAMCIFAMAPFLGPALGPIVGGFLGESEGWRWLHGLMAIFNGVIWIIITLFCPETYAPFILRHRAKTLSKATGKVYISTLDAGQAPTSLVTKLKLALTRPWVFLFKAPIVMLTSIYISIIYGTMYMCFAAFPIVFQTGRGWSPGIGGLAFVGIAIGVLLATLGFVFESRRYTRLVAKKGASIEPEDRLPPAIFGSVLIPVGLFWFAWTTFPSVHWVVPIIGSTFFALGLVLVFMSLLNYLIDSYVVFAASVLAANSVVRCLFGAAFPLFTRHMYENLGNQWAGSIPAFLALACVPFPYLFYKYGRRIRMKCEYASEAARVLQKMRAQHVETTEDEAMVEAEQV